MSTPIQVRESSLELPRIRRHRYAPVGACIYCGATDNLSDEHIVPFGLGGNLVLPRASCAACAKVTGRFEQKVLRGPLRPVRVFRRLQSRSKHREAPTILPIQLKIDGEWTTVSLPQDEYPIIAQFLLLDEPGYLNPDAYEGDIRVRGYWTHGWGPNPRDVALKFGASDIRVTQTYDPGAFALMIGKIAYAMAVATDRIDLSRGRPDIAKVIRGESSRIGLWVGWFEGEPTRAQGELHRIYCRYDSERGLLVGHVQLMCDTATPIYSVILGSLDSPYVRAAT